MYKFMYPKHQIRCTSTEVEVIFPYQLTREFKCRRRVLFLGAECPSEQPLFEVLQWAATIAFYHHRRLSASPPAARLAVLSTIYFFVDLHAICKQYPPFDVSVRKPRGVL